jgi:predicted dehydrogenase
MNRQPASPRTHRYISPMMRLGFVGNGLIAWAHVIGLQAMIEAGVLDAEIAAVYDADPKRAAGFAQVNGAFCASGVREVAERCDAVWVCTPTAAHREAVREVAERGCAVFCEKPLAEGLAEAESLACALSEIAVPVQVGLVLRSTPVFRKLRDIVESEEMGPPMAVVFRDDQYFPVQGLYNSTWRADSKVAGGGCLIEHSIHDVDILRFCMGEVDEVRGRTANFSQRGDVEDLASVSMTFASGAVADLTSLWHDISSRGSSRRVEMFFTRGLVWIDDDFRGPVHVESARGAEVIPSPSPAWVEELPLPADDTGVALRMYVEADRSFVDSVSDGRPPSPGLTEALSAHRLVDAAYRSASESGCAVALRP